MTGELREASEHLVTLGFQAMRKRSGRGESNGAVTWISKMHHAEGEGDPTQAHSHVAHGLVKGRVKDREVTFITNLNGVNIPF